VSKNRGFVSMDKKAVVVDRVDDDFLTAEARLYQLI